MVAFNSNLIKDKNEKPLSFKILTKGNMFSHLANTINDLPFNPTFCNGISFNIIDYPKRCKTFIVPEDTVVSKKYNIIVPKGEYIAYSVDPKNISIFYHHKLYMIEPYRYYYFISAVPLVSVDSTGRENMISGLLFDDFLGGKLVGFNTGSKSGDTMDIDRFGTLAEYPEYPATNIHLYHVDEKTGEYDKFDHRTVHTGAHKIFFKALNNVDSINLNDSIDKHGNTNISSKSLVNMHNDDNRRNCSIGNLSVGTQKQNSACSALLKEEFLNTKIHLSNGNVVIMKDMLYDIHRDEPLEDIKKAYNEAYKYVKSFGYKFEHILDFDECREYLEGLEK